MAQLDAWSWLYGPMTKNVAHPWYKLRTTNLRHQSQTHFAIFLLFSCFVGEEFCSCQLVKWLLLCYSSSSRSSLICLAWEQYKLAQVLNSNPISEWLYWRKFKWKKSRLKIPIELYTIQTLTKLLYCSDTWETTMFLLQDTAASPAHSSYLQ